MAMKHPHNKKSSLETILAKLVVAKMEGKEPEFYKPIFSYIQKRHKPVYHRFAVWLLDSYRGYLYSTGHGGFNAYASVSLVISAHDRCSSGKKVNYKEFSLLRKKAHGSATLTGLFDISISLHYMLKPDDQISKLSEIIQEQLHRGNDYR